MKVCVLASGSKGNTTYVETEKHSLLIDVGMSSLKTEKKLSEIGVDPHSIHSILITHSHVDHIAGLRVFMKKYHPTLYVTPKIYKEIGEDFHMYDVVFIEGTFFLDDMEISFFKTSHDTEESLGYIISSSGKSMVYVTDTGYLSEKNLNKIKDKDLYIMESNHDVEMLMNGKYPYPIKQRIVGDRGHLSNKDSSYYLSEIIGTHTKKVFLAHLSADNNTDELALSTLEEVFHKRDIAFNNVTIAHQEEISEMVEL